MRIKDFMSTNVVAVDEDTTLHDARKIMEAHTIRRLPVMKKGKLVGLVTLRMLLEAAPSPATALSIHELQYLLAKMTVKEIMIKEPYTGIDLIKTLTVEIQFHQDIGFCCLALNFCFSHFHSILFKVLINWSFISGVPMLIRT